MPRELWRESKWDDFAQRLQTASPATTRALAVAVALAATATLPECEELSTALSALAQARFADEDALANILELCDEYAETDTELAFTRACACRALAGALDEDAASACRRALNEGRYALDNETQLTALIERTLADST
jgi:hypothetical protein